MEVSKVTDAIIHPPTSGGALSAEHYQTFEMAKEHDSVLGGDNIAQIRSYAAYARAQAQAIHKTIAATTGLDDVAAIKAEAIETEQTFAKVGLYADQRIGEILRELPKAKNQWDSTAVEGQTKAEALQDAGISTPTAYQLEKLAANPDLVELVIAQAEIDGTIPSRAQVLKAIKEREDAKKEADMARRVADQLKDERDQAREEVAALEKLNDRAYEDGFKAAGIQQAQQPRVIERTVEVAPADYDAIRHERDVYLQDVQRLRKSSEELRRELDRAKDMLGMDKTLQDVRKDVQYLIAATNQYVRQYGGLTWTAASFEQVDATTLQALRKAAINLATFANALVASLEDNNA